MDRPPHASDCGDHQGRSHHARVLVIDDSDVMHQRLRAMLRHEPYEVHGAASGRDGLRMARVLRPEVVLLAHMVGTEKGYDLLREFHADAETNDIPVIFIAESANTGDIVRALDHGAIDFITSHADPAELLARIRAAVRLRRVIAMLAQRAQIDGLTGLWNRAYFDARLEDEVAKAHRHHHPASLMLCDLDRFKQINDTSGHPFGDRVLETVARMLGSGRAGDIACRYGGEEFALILPQTEPAAATAVAERLRHAIECLQWGRDLSHPITASFGIAGMVGGDAHATPARLIESADRALYQAKRGGRNGVCTAEAPGERRTA